MVLRRGGRTPASTALIARTGCTPVSLTANVAAKQSGSRVPRAVLKTKALQITQGARRTYLAMAMMNKAISAAVATAMAVAHTVGMSH